MKPVVIFLLIAVTLLPLNVLSQNAATSQPQKKIALVIGNGHYSGGDILADPVNNAVSMAEVLRKIGFTVLLQTNIDQSQMKRAIDDFGMKLKGNNVGLFYYSGYGIQSGGRNYLIPIDAQLIKEEQVIYDCVQADRILGSMEAAGAEVNIIILDACRKYPFEKNWTQSVTGEGLAAINVPWKFLIAYPNAPGASILNTKEEHGLYTSAIIECMGLPKISIIEMFQRVRRIVMQKTENKQIPWESTSLAGDFYFNTGEAIPTERAISQILEQTSSTQSANIKKTTIVFLSPQGNITTASDKFMIQACVKTSDQIEKLMIYRNGTFVDGFLKNKVVRNEECASKVDKTLALKLGMNNIKIEAFTSKDTIINSVTIEYSLEAVKNYALLIGNQKYNDPEIPDLSEPIADATELYRTLINEYTFEPENVILLKDPKKAEIIETLHQLRYKITPMDNLLIFYAGHGYWDEGMSMGYWLPNDASKESPVNWIPNTDLTNYLGAIKTKHTLLIADACFSGGIFKTREGISTTNAIEQLYQLNSRNAITSGTLDEVPDKSVLCRYLLKNLRENTNKYLSAEELFSKMRLAILNNSENVPQFGTIHNVGDEGGDFIFIKR